MECFRDRLPENTLQGSITVSKLMLDFIPSHNRTVLSTSIFPYYVLNKDPSLFRFKASFVTISYPRKLKPYQYSSYVFCAFYRRTGYLSSKIPLPNLPTSSAVYLDNFQSHFIFQVAIILNSAVLGCQPSSYADISRCRSFFGVTVAFLATTYVAAVSVVTKIKYFIATCVVLGLPRCQ